MNFLETVQKLATDNPDIDYSQCRAAMEAEVDAELKDLKGRDKYQIAVDRAYATLCDFLQHGYKADVILSWRSLAAFMSPRRHAVVWAVCIAMAREAEADAAEPPEICRGCEQPIMRSETRNHSDGFAWHSGCKTAAPLRLEPGPGTPIWCDYCGTNHVRDGRHKEDK